MIAKLHYITQEVAGFTHAQLAEFACKGGADWVQLRVKNKPFEEWLKIAGETKAVCKKYGAKLIINDHVIIAKEINADGVHLGKDDLSPAEARKTLGSSFIIGGSTNNMDDVSRMMNDGVDYIGVGPYRFTSTKEKLNPVLGLEGIKKIVQQVRIPAIAIGGIKNEDVIPLLEAGAYGIAVSSAINLAEDRIVSAQEILRSIKTVNEKQFQG